MTPAQLFALFMVHAKVNDPKRSGREAEPATTADLMAFAAMRRVG